MTSKYKVIQKVNRKGKVLWDVKKLFFFFFWIDIHNSDYFSTKEDAEDFINKIEEAKGKIFYITYHHS